jgi:hypothetical protein
LPGSKLAEEDQLSAFASTTLPDEAEGADVKIKGSKIDDDNDNSAEIENVKGDGPAGGSEVQHDGAPLAPAESSTPPEFDSGREAWLLRAEEQSGPGVSLPGRGGSAVCVMDNVLSDVAAEESKGGDYDNGEDQVHHQTRDQTDEGSTCSKVQYDRPPR